MLPARRDVRRWANQTAPADSRGGFALPLALFGLVVLALVVALLLDAALQDLRASRGDVARARAEAAGESAFADLVSVPVDSAVLLLPRGAAHESVHASAHDTVRVTVQSLGGDLFRAVFAGRSWAGGVRADATTLAWLRVLPDSGPAPAGLRYRRLPGWWWAQVP